MWPDSRRDNGSTCRRVQSICCPENERVANSQYSNKDCPTFCKRIGVRPLFDRWQRFVCRFGSGHLRGKTAVRYTLPSSERRTGDGENSHYTHVGRKCKRFFVCDELRSSRAVVNEENRQQLQCPARTTCEGELFSFEPRIVLVHIRSSLANQR
jgi:hypothetical protein